MIQAFQNFVQWVVDLGRVLVDFLMNVINGLIQLFKMLPVISNLTLSSVAYLPTILASFVGISLTILIVYIIVGRDTGG